MTGASGKYEAVIGLEVHARLDLRSKLFSAESAQYGAEPNTNIGFITLAHPGTLPKTNKKAVEYAVKLGLACNCEIERHNYFARKNYFYPDLPKGYQISQHTAPICKGGHITITTEGTTKNVQLNRIHLEEDAGKSIHDLDENFTCIDLNRAGTTLVEIVTEPALYSADEAFQFVTELRRLVRWIGVCDGNMEEGSMRCDANVSIRLRGETELGTKVEVKNLNSIRNVKKAIEVEIDRMTAQLEAGERIIQQTRSFDATNDTTFALRDKEEANDYRYFPDPDLPPFNITDQMLEAISDQMPALPNELLERFQQAGLSEYDARQLCSEKETADYFQQVLTHTGDAKSAANWINGPLKQLANEQKVSVDATGISPQMLASIIAMIADNTVNFSSASSRLLPALAQQQGNTTAREMAEKLNLVQVSDNSELEKWVDEVIARMPAKVEEYKKGKKGLIGLFVGEVKKASRGKADPQKVTALLQQKLS